MLASPRPFAHDGGQKIERPDVVAQIWTLTCAEGHLLVNDGYRVARGIPGTASPFVADWFLVRNDSSRIRRDRIAIDDVRTTSERLLESC